MHTSALRNVFYLGEINLNKLVSKGLFKQDVLSVSKERGVVALMEMSARPEPSRTISGGTIACTHVHKMPS